MHNPWKLATLGLIALGATVGASTLTTAYLVRPPARTPEPVPPVAPPPSAARPAVVRVAAPPARMVPARLSSAASPRVPVAVAPAPVPAAGDAPAPPVLARDRVPEGAPPPVPAVTPVSAPSPPSTTSPAADCRTGGDRALRIAKPGALGAVLGAGLGAAGGAIAGGGKGAGKGALIGGLAGAALGTGYGAYTTKQECGTILGGDAMMAGERAPAPAGGFTPRPDIMAPLSPGAGAERIQIYDAR